MSDAERTLQEAIRAGCKAANIHLTCSYPECACKQLPVAIPAAIAKFQEIEAEGWISGVERKIQRGARSSGKRFRL